MNSKRQSKTSGVIPASDEKGFVLIAVIMLLIILALIGTVAVITTTTEIKISSNYKTNAKSLYAAQAGTEEARARLRGSSSDVNYVGDDSSPPNELWSVYVGTSSSWETTDDPDHDSNYTNTGVNSIQSDISYWVKIRHKKWSDCTDAEQDTVIDTSNTSGGTPGDPDIIYYGYATSTATTAVPFTSDDAPATASPVEIITSYGSSNKSLNIIEVQARQNPGPPIPGAIYGNNVDIKGNVTINGDDEGCSDDSVPTVAYVTSLDQDGNTSLVSDAGESIISPVLDLESQVNTLESIKTVTLTEDQTGYSVGSSSNYEVVYCDATILSPDNELDLNNVTGYGTLVIKGNVNFGGSVTWYGLIIVYGNIEVSGNGNNIHGAILADNISQLSGNININYNSCKLNNANNSYLYSIFRWEDKKLNQ